MEILHNGTAQQNEDWYNALPAEKRCEIIGVNAATGKPEPEKCRTVARPKKIPHPTEEDNYVWYFGDNKDDNLTSWTEQDATNAGFFMPEENR